MSKWRTASAIFWKFEPGAPEACLDVSLRGSVALQRKNAAGEWETFEIITAPRMMLAVSNSPALRIEPIGGASYRLSR